MVEPQVNREHIAIGLIVALAACGAVPAFAKDAPKPKISLEPIAAPNLLAPVEDVRGNANAYRLDPLGEQASGQRARLSIDIGDSTLFAISGRLKRQPGAPGPLDASHAKALGLKRSEGGKVYGAGISRNISGIDVSATYQYSKISAEQPVDAGLTADGPGKSHSLRGTMRIRFRP